MIYSIFISEVSEMRTSVVGSFDIPKGRNPMMLVLEVNIDIFKGKKG